MLVQWISLQLSMQYCSYQIATKMQKLTTITNYTIIFQVCLPVYHSTTATGLHAHYVLCGIGLFHSVGGSWMNTYLQDGTILCNHSGILNQLMIDKFTADIKRTKKKLNLLFNCSIELTIE